MRAWIKSWNVIILLRFSEKPIKEAANTKRKGQAQGQGQNQGPKQSKLTEAGGRPEQV